MNKKIIVLLGLCLALLTGCGSNESQEVLNVYNWGDYIDESLITKFEEETGIKVVYDTFSSNEDMYIKVKQGIDSYDILVPSDYMIERMIQEDMLEEIDLSKLPNFANVNEKLKNPEFDPENKYSVSYFWGTGGIIYNAKEITDPIDSWTDLFNEKYSGKIIMYNSSRDSIAVALKALGYSMNSTDPAELEAAKNLLLEQKPHVLAYQADEGRDTIVSGDGHIGFMYSGDALMMMEQNPDLQYVLPKEGPNIWFDAMVIPKGHQNYEAALKFINFMCDPENAAVNAEYSVGFSSPIDAAIELLPDEIKNSKVAYPDGKDLENGEIYKNDSTILSTYDKIWTEVTNAN
ncbi:MAG: spermidine/putrescine ABC transporter substrate-binding protein [Bacillota bacterium]|nr:spermidine/putrescine ABC transporter substrate-binding protein [Bacillota bacterium]